MKHNTINWKKKTNVVKTKCLYGLRAFHILLSFINLSHPTLHIILYFRFIPTHHNIPCIQSAPRRFNRFGYIYNISVIEWNPHNTLCILLLHYCISVIYISFFKIDSLIFVNNLGIISILLQYIVYRNKQICVCLK